MRLLDIVETIDRLHANSGLDIRHREIFTRRMELVWPHLSDKIKDLVRRSGANYLGVLLSTGLVA